MVKLQKNEARGNFFLIIPKSVISGLGWEKGDGIVLTIESKDTLLLRRKT